MIYRELCSRCMALFVCKKGGNMKILIVAAVLIIIFLLVVMFGAISGIIKVNKAMMHDMQNADRAR